MATLRTMLTNGLTGTTEATMTTATNTQILHQPGIPNHRPGAARTPIFLPSRSARASGGPLLARYFGDGLGWNLHTKRVGSL